MMFASKRFFYCFLGVFITLTQFIYSEGTSHYNDNSYNPSCYPYNTTNEHKLASLPKSPCPDVFQYESPGTDMGPPARWCGVINLFTDTTLESLMLNIVLDRKADIIGTWIGDVTSTDNLDFKIENTTLKISAGTTTEIRFFVHYDALDPTPKLQAIRLNSRDICNANTLQPAIYVVDLTDRSTNVKMPHTKPKTLPKSIPEANSEEHTHPQTKPIQQSSKPTNSQSMNIGEESQPSLTMLSSQSNTKPESDKQVQCGKVVLNSQNVTLVSNGEPTSEGQWPWQIALYKTQNVNVEYICGGTLVSHRHVITAAHCVTKKKSTEKVENSILTVYLGKHNLRTSIKGVQIKFVEKIIVHPNYTVPVSRDIAILELQEPVKYSYWVRPVCLWPESQIDLKNVIGKKGSVVGWGFDDEGIVMEELALVEMPVVNQETCLRSHPFFFVQFTSEYTFCASNRNGTAVCSGDSGNGMVFQTEGIWYLRGIVSVAVAKENRCDPSYNVIFTDIAKFLPWIKQNIYDY